MLRIFNKDVLLPALTLVAIFSLVTLAVPGHVQAVTIPENNADNLIGVAVSGLAHFASDTTCPQPTPGGSCTTSCAEAQDSKCTDPAISQPLPGCASSNSNCNLIQEYVVPTINLLGATFGLVAVISLILGGINYTTSEGDPQKVSRAKIRIRNTIFSIVAFLFLYAFLNFLIPGGVIK
jgi:hypothetical protein